MSKKEVDIESVKQEAERMIELLKGKTDNEFFAGTLNGIEFVMSRLEGREYDGIEKYE